MKIEAPGLEAASSEGMRPVPPGRYSVRVTGCEQQTGRESGKDYIAWEFSIIENEEYVGRKLFLNSSLQPQCRDMLKRALVAMQMPMDGDSFNTEDGFGLELDVQAGIRRFKPEGSDEEEERNEVKDTFPVTGA